MDFDWRESPHMVSFLFHDHHVKPTDAHCVMFPSLLPLSQCRHTFAKAKSGVSDTKTI